MSLLTKALSVRRKQSTSLNPESSSSHDAKEVPTTLRRRPSILTLGPRLSALFLDPIPDPPSKDASNASSPFRRRPSMAADTPAQVRRRPGGGRHASGGPQLSIAERRRAIEAKVEAFSKDPPKAQRIGGGRHTVFNPAGRSKAEKSRNIEAAVEVLNSVTSVKQVGGGRHPVAIGTSSRRSVLLRESSRATVTTQRDSVPVSITKTEENARPAKTSLRSEQAVAEVVRTPVNAGLSRQETSRSVKKLTKKSARPAERTPGLRQFASPSSSDSTHSLPLRAGPVSHAAPHQTRPSNRSLDSIAVFAQSNQSLAKKSTSVPREPNPTSTTALSILNAPSPPSTTIKPASLKRSKHNPRNPVHIELTEDDEDDMRASLDNNSMSEHASRYSPSLSNRSSSALDAYYDAILTDFAAGFQKTDDSMQKSKKRPPFISLN